MESEYKRQGGNLMSAYKDANDGTNGGMRIILDAIADHLKEESVERYIRYRLQPDTSIRRRGLRRSKSSGSLSTVIGIFLDHPSMQRIRKDMLKITMN